MHNRGANPPQTNPKYLTYIDDAVAYVNSTALYGSKVDEYEKTFLDRIDKYSPNTTYDDGVIAGYKAICNTTASKIFTSPIGQIELLFMNSDGSGDVGVTAALQHPFSHGRIYINSSDPMDYPVIDPNYFANPSGTCNPKRPMNQTNPSPCRLRDPPRRNQNGP
jgi:hypothetical protein